MRTANKSCHVGGLLRSSGYLGLTKCFSADRLYYAIIRATLRPMFAANANRSIVVVRVQVLMELRHFSLQ